MSIIHVRQIEAKLRSLFNNLIELSDCDNKSSTDKDSVFLTRSLAAFAILANTDITPEQAALCITDGFQDNGIDAIYFDDREKILFLVQTKWRHEGTGSIERGDALKFINGVKDLINAEFERFNEKISKRSVEIIDALSVATTRIVLLVAYTGQAPLAPDISRDFDDFLREMNDASDVVEFKLLKQGNLHNIIASGTLGAPINFDVVLRDWGQVREPFLAYYGRVSTTEVATWWDQHHPRLFAPNIRSFLGTTEINQGIVDTLLSEPEKFWYFNNGITALCSTIRKKLIGGNAHDSGVFECTDVSIVNGAQTVGAISTANAKAPDKAAKATVLVRFISLENCPDDFAIRVTRATNTQNRIENRDFVSLDPEQGRLRTELQLDGIDYVYKSGYSLRDTKNGFDLTEATVALACSHADLSYAVQAKRGIGVLWEDVSKAPYKALFNSGVSSVRLWRLVRIHRTVEEQLKIERNKRQGREAMLPVHANRFLARQVFKHISPYNLDDPRTDIQTILDSIPKTTTRVIEATMSAINEKYPESYLANLFKNSSKSQDIEALVESKLNA
jgi:AIPR protein